MRRLSAKFSIDLALWALATPLAYFMRLEGDFASFGAGIALLTLIGIPLKAAAIYLFRLPWRSWHHVGVRDLSVLLYAVAAVSSVLFIVVLLVPGILGIPRSGPVIEAMLAVLMLCGARLGTRLYDGRTKKARVHGNRRRVLIAGAGEAGTMIAREMLRHPESGMLPIGFVDDADEKQRNLFGGLPVVGRLRDISGAVKEHGVDEVLIAMPSSGGAVVRYVIEQAREAKVGYKTVPALHDLLSGKVAIAQIREVNLEDLLGRAPVRLDEEYIRGYVANKTVLVSGAGGSIGSELARQCALFGAHRLVLLGRGENSIFSIHNEVRMRWPHIDVIPVICDVRNKERLRYVFERERPEVVFHGAAHKHVPLMEANPDEAVFNNIQGTQNMSALALEYEVERLVNVSTDKAVNPSSVMGATKRVAELVVADAASRATERQQFVSVRFGNVLGSRGSVVPLFKEQIRHGGPVTVTDPEMTRYFMTIPEASQLVLQAGAIGSNGCVYVLDMGDPVKIVDLAEDMIRLSGFEPYVDIDIEFAGKRPGEKLFEELLTAEDGTAPSVHEKIFVARKNGMPEGQLERTLTELYEAAATRDAVRIRAALRRLMPPNSLPEPDVRGDGADANALEQAPPEVTPLSP